MKIVADPNIPFVREAFGALGEIFFVPGRQIAATITRDADLLLIRSVTPVNSALLDGSHVRFVATATIGTDHVDLDYLRSRGIGFASAAGSNANSVAEYIVAAMLELARRHKFRLRDKTLGVIGVGNVGSRVVRCAQALGMHVLPNDPPRQRAENLPQFVSLKRILAEADIITTHVPLTREGPDATFHLFDKDRIAALEADRPFLMNTARGVVMENRSLLKAIDGEWIGGVVLDVWENEPNILTELLDVVDIGTPHIAGYSFDGKANGVQMIYQAVCSFFGVQPLWKPSLPSPEVPTIELTVSSGEDEEEVQRRVVRHVYDITADDAALRANIRAFDRLRAEYPIRREFFNTTLVLRGASDSLRSKFSALGFKIG
ncbi:MAG TPA: 4-phosphoerythronate dehydrogenase PdxB [Verrucomicrobiae bacterium]|nr:4-phosphoerythronate dehydrogenase PdxB [Verrucomicrobiae bacterium]